MVLDYFGEKDRAYYNQLPKQTLLGIPDWQALSADPRVETYEVYYPSPDYRFTHECAIIEYHGTLFASWYNCPERELAGNTPIRGRRSKDGGKTWSPIEVLARDPSGKILYCPPVYGIARIRYIC